MKMMKKEVKEHTRLIDMHLDRLGCNDIDEYKPLPYAIGTIVKILPNNRWEEGYGIVQEVGCDYDYSLLTLRDGGLGAVAWVHHSEVMFVEDATPKSLSILALAPSYEEE